jgi:hypothetical protein
VAITKLTDRSIFIAKMANFCKFKNNKISEIRVLRDLEQIDANSSLTEESSLFILAQEHYPELTEEYLDVFDNEPPTLISEGTHDLNPKNELEN